MTTSTERVAIITGGSGGMGLAVAQALAAQGTWQIHLVDIKDEEGRRAAASLPRTTFHRADLVQYDEVVSTFRAAFTAGGRNRLDFVFANAGMIEKSDMYTRSDSFDGPPAPPDLSAIDVNLKGCVYTVHVARHYLNLSPDKGSIVITASSTSFWPVGWAPIYTASKFGIMGYLRAVAHEYKNEGIRLNALCPGPVRTALLKDEDWNAVPDDAFASTELISEVVLKLLEGQEIVDSNGVRITPEKLYGQAIVANMKKIYVQSEIEYCDEEVALATGIMNSKPRLVES